MASKKISMAVLFVDVSDSTRMYDSLGDTAAFGNVQAINGQSTGTDPIK